MTRKAPEMPAKNFEVGKRKRGMDGEMYVVATYMREGKKIKRWVKAKKRSTTSPKRMDGWNPFRKRKKERQEGVSPERQKELEQYVDKWMEIDRNENFTKEKKKEQQQLLQFWWL